MKKLILCVLLGVLVFSIRYASGQTTVAGKEKTALVHVGFIPPISSNGLYAGEYTNTFSFHFLAGLSKNERAFTLSGIANIIKNNSSGFQMSGLGNYVGNEGHGVLISGMGNFVRNNYSGLQMAGLINISGDIRGVQIGGLINIAKNVSGVQFAGLINIADHSDYPIGLINIIKDGEMSVALTYNEVGTAGVTFRSGGRGTYGILGVGYNHKTKGNGFTSIAGLGAHINITSWFRINNEVTVENFGAFSDDNTFKAGFSILPAFRFLRHFEVFGGPSINYMQTENMDNNKMFPSNSLWDKKGALKLQQVYIGYQVGLQYIF